MASSERTGQDFDPQRALEGRNLAYDPARRLVDFETVPIATERDEPLVPGLQAIGRHDLSDDLQRALERDEPAPAWSHTSYRDYRRWWTNEAATLAHEAKAASGQFGVVASIIAAGFTAPIGGLAAVAPRDVFRAIWKGLDRPDFQGFQVIGGVDVSFNEKAGANQLPGFYQVHAGLAFLGHVTDQQSCERLREALKAAFDLEPTAPIPVQVKELRDPVEQLSYLMKRVFVRRVSIIDSQGRKNTLRCPLKPAQAAEIADWLSGFPQTDRLILKGLRRHGDRIVPSPTRRHREGGE